MDLCAPQLPNLKSFTGNQLNVNHVRSSVFFYNGKSLDDINSTDDVEITPITNYG